LSYIFAHYESLNFYLRLISLTMLLRQTCSTTLLLSTVGTKKVMILLLWEKNLKYKFSKNALQCLLWFVIVVATCLIRNIACKQFKIVKIPNNCLLVVLCSYNIYSKDPNVLCIIVYIYLQSCTTMVSHLVPFMADITHSHCFEYISMLLHYNQCLMYMSRIHFSMWIQLQCLFGIGLTGFW